MQLAGLQLRREREQRAAIWADAVAVPGPARTPSSHRPPAAAALPFRLGHNRIGEDCARRFDVFADRNFDQAVTDAAHAVSHPRAGGLDLVRLRFGHQDGARSLVSSHVNPDTSVLVDQVPAPAP